ncbi:MAG: N-methyl-L-tryptophan oxidase [Planctomycetota bacterium]
MSRPNYDAIVLGAGGVGSAAMWRLAARGLRVLGIDRHTPPHGLGSSHGQTRIIRQAYFEHPDYVPLLLEAYRLWGELASASEAPLLVRSGVLQVGPADGGIVSGVLQSARTHAIPVERVEAREVRERWPLLRVSEGHAGVFEPTGGYLHVEACVQACLDAAIGLGAELMTGVTAHGWAPDGGAQRVQTSAGEFACERLIVTAGAWSGPLLQAAGVPLTIRRKSVFWFDPPPGPDAPRLPPYLFELPTGVFYGFPPVGDWGMKVGDHAGGAVLDRPEAIDRTVDPAEEHAVRHFLAEHVPRVGLAARLGPAPQPAVRRHSACYYTMSPDGHFVLDRLPGEPRVSFAAGLSGHGFKFAPVLGEALADLATTGASRLPIDFLSLARLRA